MKFYRNAEVELLAENRLQELATLLGKPLTPPIPIELLAEKILGLNFLWDTITEEPGEVILAGLKPREKLIVLNESHKRLFEDKPGLERFTIGHELGHWDLFINKDTLEHPNLPGLAKSDPFVRRSSSKGPVDIMRFLIRSPKGVEILRDMQSRTDHKDEARAVNRFSAAICMPAALLRAEAVKVDRTHWRNLYPLAEKFGVTITALSVRLKQLNLLAVKEDGELFASPDDAIGQMTLGLE